MVTGAPVPTGTAYGDDGHARWHHGRVPEVSAPITWHRRDGKRDGAASLCRVVRHSNSYPKFGVSLGGADVCPLATDMTALLVRKQ